MLEVRLGSIKWSYLIKKATELLKFYNHKAHSLEGNPYTRVIIDGFSNQSNYSKAIHTANYYKGVVVQSLQEEFEKLKSQNKTKFYID